MPETSKKPKPNKPDSRLRGNDGGAVSVFSDKCRNLKSRHSNEPTFRHSHESRNPERKISKKPFYPASLLACRRGAWDGIAVAVSDAALFDDDFRESAAEVFAFVGNAQGDLECGIGVDSGDGGVFVEQLRLCAAVHGFAHGQA